MSPGPACTESAATTYCGVGALVWSCTCTTSRLRPSIFSSLRVATTLPTTLPINMGVGPLAVQKGHHARARQRLLEEAPAQLAVHLAAHHVPAGRRARGADPQQRRAAGQDQRSHEAPLAHGAARVGVGRLADRLG